MRKSICVLVSGGLDSDVLLSELAERYQSVVPVYVRQGLAWERAELYWLKKFISALQASPRPRLSPRKRALGEGRIRPLRILSLPMQDVYGSHWSLGGRPVPGSRSADSAVYLPGRNLALTVKAAVLCAREGIREIALGSLGDNPFPDATPAFFRTWGQALSQGLKVPLVIRAPYRSQNKAEIIHKGRGLPLELSFSCIAPKGYRHCGRCNKCAERRRAFREAGVFDKTPLAAKIDSRSVR